MTYSNHWLLLETAAAYIVYHIKTMYRNIYRLVLSENRLIGTQRGWGVWGELGAAEGDWTGLFLVSNDEDALSSEPCLSVSGKRWREEY